LGLAAARSG